MGSFFAWRCTGDRPLYLRMLATRAKDPFVRVAGATYLCFEDEQEGLRARAGLMELPGDPGVWAALGLARRGNRSAMPRALEVFRPAPDPPIAHSMHRNLQARLLVLLSNSASKERGAPQPGRWWSPALVLPPWPSRRAGRALAGGGLSSAARA